MKKAFISALLLVLICFDVLAGLEWLGYGGPRLLTFSLAALAALLTGAWGLKQAKSGGRSDSAWWLAALLLAHLVVFLAWKTRLAWWVVTSPRLNMPERDAFWIVAGLAAVTLVLLHRLLVLVAGELHPALGRWGRRLFFVIWSVTLAILGGEALFRTAGNLGRNNWEVYESSWSHRPGAEFRWRGHFGEVREFDTRVKNNRYGYHDLDWPEEKAAGVRRIVMLGDSYVEAHQVALEESVHKQLQSRLSASGDSVEVIGLGHSGHGTKDEAETLASLGFPFQPDLVLLAFLPANDVRDSDPELKQRADEESGFRLGQSRTYYLLRYYRLRFPGHLLWWADRRLADRRRAGRPPLDNYVFTTRPAEAAWARAWLAVESAVAGMDAECRARGIRFAVISFTSLQQIPGWAAETDETDRETVWNLTARWPLPPEGEWDFTASDRRMEDFCRAQGIPVLVLAREFARLPPDERRRLHFQADGHWTPFGHQQAARAIADFIEQENLLHRL
jgi:hypothetical protein